MSTVVNLGSRTAAVGKKGLLWLGIALLVFIGLLGPARAIGSSCALVCDWRAAPRLRRTARWSGHRSHRRAWQDPSGHLKDSNHEHRRWHRRLGCETAVESKRVLEQLLESEVPGWAEPVIVHWQAIRRLLPRCRRRPPFPLRKALSISSRHGTAKGACNHSVFGCSNRQV